MICPKKNKTKSKIISIVTQMEGGGAQAASMRLTKGLRNRGYRAETWFLYIKRPTYIKKNGVRYLLSHPPRHPLDYIYIFAKLLQYIKRESPDCVITFTHYSNILGQVAALLAGIKNRIASQRNPSWSYPRLAGAVDHLLGILGLYTKNIMVSKAVQATFSHYNKRYNKNVCVVHNGINYTGSSLSQTQARIKFSLPKNSPLVVTVGRLAEQKNQATLIKAVGKLPQTHLAIAGDGELRQYLRGIVNKYELQNKIHFMGEIHPAEIPDFLKSADIFAIPSRFEGLSNALLEAISEGLPVITSHIPAQAEVIQFKPTESCGILVAPDNIHAWAEHVQALCEDPTLRRRLGESAKKRAEDFTVEKMITGFEREINSGNKRGK